MDRFCYNSNNDWFDVLFCLNWSSWITWIVRLRLLRIQSLYCFDSILLHSAFTIYTLTLSHSGNDHDVTESAQGYKLQDVFFVRQSRCSFLNAWENTQVACAMTSVFVWNTRWRHGRSRSETKYSVYQQWRPSLT